MVDTKPKEHKSASSIPFPDQLKACVSTYRSTASTPWAEVAWR